MEEKAALPYCESCCKKKLPLFSDVDGNLLCQTCLDPPVTMTAELEVTLSLSLVLILSFCFALF